MKKWITVLTALALLLSSGTAAMAHGNGGKHKGYDVHAKMCKGFPPGLLKQLEKAKDKKNKQQIEAIKKALDAYKKQCGDKDGRDDDGKLTDAQRVALDKAALRIGYSGSDLAGSVTGALKLPVKGKFGSTITWTSSRPDILAPNGQLVSRPASDVAVVLTATIAYNGTTATASFTVTVKAAAPALTDAQRVAADKAALSIAFNGTDNAGQVTQPLKPLPVKGANGSAITWISSAPAILSNDGATVVRPSGADASVTLTAILTYGSASDTKAFPLTVKQQLTDAQAVAADKAALEIDFGGSDTAASVTRPLDALPSKGANGSAITWISSAPAVLSADGKTLVRPAAGSGDVNVVLTAILTKGSASDVKTFTLTVKDQFTAAELLAADKAELAIGFAAGDSAASVTKPLTLPVKGAYGSTILWYSSNTAVVSDNGLTVNRPARGAGDAVVTLIAYLSYNGMGDYKTFTVTVKQQA